MSIDKISGKKIAMRSIALLGLPLCLALSSCGPTDDKEPNAPVVAKISTTPFVIAEMPTTLNAEESTVPTNVDVTYSYDTDGDGNFETSPEGYQATLSHTFKEPGDYKVGVKIEDETGQSSQADIEFKVYPADYLSADKKSELKSVISTVTGKAIIQTQVNGVKENIALRVYLNGKNANTAKGAADIKLYEPWEVAGGSTVTHEIDISDLSPGKYNGTIFSDAGPERNVEFTVK